MHPAVHAPCLDVQKDVKVQLRKSQGLDVAGSCWIKGSERKIINDHQYPSPGASKWSHLPLKEVWTVSTGLSTTHWRKNLATRMQTKKRIRIEDCTTVHLFGLDSHDPTYSLMCHLGHACSEERSESPWTIKNGGQTKRDPWTIDTGSNNAWSFQMRNFCELFRPSPRCSRSYEAGAPQKKKPTILPPTCLRRASSWSMMP